MILVESDASADWDSRGDWAGLAERAVKAAVAASAFAWLGESEGDCEVSVRFSSDEVVRALNASWRAKDKPTNVLSFPMVEPALIATIGKAGAVRPCSATSFSPTASAPAKRRRKASASRLTPPI